MFKALKRFYQYMRWLFGYSNTYWDTSGRGNATTSGQSSPEGNNSSSGNVIKHHGNVLTHEEVENEVTKFIESPPIVKKIVTKKNWTKEEALSYLGILRGQIESAQKFIINGQASNVMFNAQSVSNTITDAMNYIINSQPIVGQKKHTTKKKKSKTKKGKS